MQTHSSRISFLFSVRSAVLTYEALGDDANAALWAEREIARHEVKHPSNCIVSGLLLPLRRCVKNKANIPFFARHRVPTTTPSRSTERRARTNTQDCRLCLGRIARRRGDADGARAHFEVAGEVALSTRYPLWALQAGQALGGEAGEAMVERALEQAGKTREECAELLRPPRGVASSSAAASGGD